MSIYPTIAISDFNRYHFNTKTKVCGFQCGMKRRGCLELPLFNDFVTIWWKSLSTSAIGIYFPILTSRLYIIQDIQTSGRPIKVKGTFCDHLRSRVIQRNNACICWLPFHWSLQWLQCQRRKFWIQCLHSDCLYFYTCLLRVCAVLLFLLNRVPWWQPGQTLSLSCKVAGYSLDKLLFSYTLDTAVSRKSTGVDIRHRLWWGHIRSASPETPPVTQ